METDKHFDQLCRLWKAIGGVQAYADPDAYSARTPEQRLAGIWEIVKELELELELYRA